MRPEPPPFVNIFPAEQDEILFEHLVNLLFRESLADGPAVFVIHHAARLVEDLPTALPSFITEVRVFEEEGRWELAEPAQREKLAAIESAGAAAAVKARERLG